MKREYTREAHYYRIEEFSDLQTKSRNLFQEKNWAYRDAYIRNIHKHGKSFALGRLEDKFSRFEALLADPSLATSEEAIEDTLIDLSNYALLTLIALKELSGSELIE